MKIKNNFFSMLSVTIFFSAVFLFLPAIEFANAESANLSLSADGHTIEKNGSPIFLMGDTVWTIHITRTSSEQDSYLSNARSNGFNLIGIFALPLWAMDQSHAWNSMNEFGERPFNDNNFTNLNPAFWDRLIHVVMQAENEGMYVMIHAGELLEEGKGYPLDTDQKAYDFGYALGNYFKNYNSNIIWTPSQDSGAPGSMMSISKIDALAEGITDGASGASINFDGSASWNNSFFSWHGDLITHNDLDPIRNKDWLDTYGYETYEYIERIVPVSSGLWTKSPAKPAINNEPCYELGSACGSAWESRFQACWAVFSGGTSYTYGAVGLMDDGRNEEGRSWDDGLNAAGRLDMQHLKNLIDSQGVQNLIPDQSYIISDTRSYGSSRDYITAVRGKNHNFAFVYSTKGYEFDIDLNKLTGIDGDVCARWYDPRSGNYTDVGTYSKSTRQFDPPGSPGSNNDCILVLSGSTIPEQTLVISNLTAQSGKIYEVADNGLQPGALVYIDRSHTFTSIPSDFTGRTYVKTANDDKDSSGSSFLSFTVNQDATVYIAYNDLISLKPSWLSSFVDTGNDLVTSDTTLSLLSRNFSAGTVTLGGNQGAGKSMYSVVITKRVVEDTTPPAAPSGLTVQ